MNALDLVAPDYREAAEVIPIFDYDTQPVEQIREALLQAYGQKYGSPDAVAKEVVSIAREGEPPVRALLYRPKSGVTRGAILHIHGGGWIAGTADMMAGFCAGVADRHGVVVLSVDYRLVPEAPGDAALDDCFAALSWLHAEAERLGVDADHIAVMGDSAGGNLAAGIALRARDAGLPIRAQLLLYPALAGVAPAFIVVGSIDVLVDEAIDYAGRLGRAGRPVELSCLLRRLPRLRSAAGRHDGSLRGRPGKRH